MTNIIGQLLIVLAVNVTTNCVEFTKFEEAETPLCDSHVIDMSTSYITWAQGPIIGTGVLWVATDATTNVPISKQIETRIGTNTKGGGSQYLFSVWSAEAMTNGLPDCWRRLSVHWDSIGVGVSND